MDGCSLVLDRSIRKTGDTKLTRQITVRLIVAASDLRRTPSRWRRTAPRAGLLAMSSRIHPFLGSRIQDGSTAGEGLRGRPATTTLLATSTSWRSSQIAPFHAGVSPMPLPHAPPQPLPLGCLLAASLPCHAPFACPPAQCLIPRNAHFLPQVYTSF